jgi:molybdate transport system substrate-binding protein
MHTLKLRLLMVVLATATTAAALAQTAATEVSVFAAGSLRAALTEASKSYEAMQPGVRLRFTFGASGLLKDRLLAGENADVFASANMEHPQALNAAGKAQPVQRFTRNTLCALVRPGLDVTPQTLVQRMLDPAIKLGTSTPKADPSGDYAWQMFERIEQGGVPNAFAALSAKALQLTGGPQSPAPPADRNVYGVLVARGAADLFITYCTNAVLAQREEPSLRVVNVPEAINVSAGYGIALLNPPSAAGQGFVDFLLAPAGQAALARHGFSRVEKVGGAGSWRSTREPLLPYICKSLHRGTPVLCGSCSANNAMQIDRRSHHPPLLRRNP